MRFSQRQIQSLILIVTPLVINSARSLAQPLTLAQKPMLAKKPAITHDGSSRLTPSRVVWSQSSTSKRHITRFVYYRPVAPPLAPSSLASSSLASPHIEQIPSTPYSTFPLTIGHTTATLPRVRAYTPTVKAQAPVLLATVATSLAHFRSNLSPQRTPLAQPRPQLTGQLGSEPAITALAFSADGRALMSGRANGTVTVWQVATRKTLRTLNLPRGRLAFSCDGSLVANAVTARPVNAAQKSGPPEVSIWDLQTGVPRHTLRPFADKPMLGALVTALAFSPDNRTLAIAVGAINYGSVQLWDVATGLKLRTLQEIRGDMKLSYGVSTVAFSPDGKTLAANDFISIKANPLDSDMPGYRGPAVGIWDVQTGQCLKTFERSRPPFCFAPDSSTLATAAKDRKAMHLWNLSNGRHLKTLTAQGAPLIPLTFTPGSKILWSDGNGLRQFDVQSSAPLSAIPNHPRATKSCVSPDGALAARGLENGTIEIWRTATP